MFFPDLQKQFDKDVKSNCITRETWHPNATNEGILAYKLLVQTGDIDNPVNKDQVNKLYFLIHCIVPLMVSNTNPTKNTCVVML